MPLSIYKQGQGKLARFSAAGLLGILILFGCYELYQWLTRSFDFPRSAVGTIPFVEQDLNVAFFVVVLLAGAGAYGTYYLLNLPKSADLLIDTESEMRRVTWPSWPEALNSSLVVIVAVVTIAMYLAGVDFVLNQLFGVIFSH